MLRSETFAARLKQENLASKNNVFEFLKSSDLGKKIEKLATELKIEKHKVKKLQTYD